MILVNKLRQVETPLEVEFKINAARKNYLSKSAMETHRIFIVSPTKNKFRLNPFLVIFPNQKGETMKTKRTEKIKAANSMMEALEERVLFDGVPDTPFLNEDLANVAPVQTISQQDLQQQSERRELVVIDAAVEDKNQLIASLLNSNSSLEIIELDSNSSGVEQISRAISENGVRYDAIHIMSHGNDGQLELGSETLDTESLAANAGEIASWSDYLSEDADLLIYGCNLAASEDGEFFLESLSTLTGADVAASDDLTGSSRFGGDWTLEVAVGRIETVELKAKNWQYTLLNPVASETEGFLVLVEEDATLTSNESEGGIAVGGDLTIGGNYQAGFLETSDLNFSNGTFSDPENVSLLVGGQLNALDSEGAQLSLNNGVAHIGDLGDSTLVDDGNISAIVGTTADGEQARIQVQGLSVNNDAYQEQLSLIHI